MTNKHLHEMAQQLADMSTPLPEDKLVEMHIELQAASLADGRTEEYLRNEMEAQMHMMEVLVGTQPTRSIASKMTMVAARQRMEIRELMRKLAKFEGGFAE